MGHAAVEIFLQPRVRAGQDHAGSISIWARLPIACACLESGGMSAFPGTRDGRKALRVGNGDMPPASRDDALAGPGADGAANGVERRAGESARSCARRSRALALPVDPPAALGGDPQQGAGDALLHLFRSGLAQSLQEFLRTPAHDGERVGRELRKPAHKIIDLVALKHSTLVSSVAVAAYRICDAPEYARP